MCFTFHGNLIPHTLTHRFDWGIYLGAGILVEEVIGFHSVVYRPYMR